MADAGPCRHPRDGSTAIRGGRSQGRRVVLPVRGAKGHGGLRRGRARRGALRGALRTVRPAWRSRSDPHRYGAEAGFLLSRAVRAVRAASAVDGDRRDPGRAGARDWRALSRPIHRRHRGEELEAPSRRRARRTGDRPHRDDAGRARRRRAVVTADGGVDRRRHPGPLRQGPHAARAAGRTRVAEQAVPHLPQPGRRGRPPRSGAGRHRDAPDPRSEIVLTVTTRAGPGSPGPWPRQMGAGPAAATPARYVRGRTPLELQGALVLQNKQCRTCHSLGGEGGRRGPALDGIATRQTRDQLIRQVLQGGGNMPAYGKNLSPAEVNALVAFMETLRP